MRKDEFLIMMVQDNETRPQKEKEFYADVIDYMDFALSQTPASTEIDASKTVEGVIEMINTEGKKVAQRQGNVGILNPFKSAELIAKYLGVTYERATKRFSVVSVPDIDLDDL